MKVKRYSSRKFYDVERRKHLSLEDLERAVLEDQPLEVVDGKTGADLTALTLLMVLSWRASEGQSYDVVTLRELVRSAAAKTATRAQPPVVADRKTLSLGALLDEEDRQMQEASDKRREELNRSLSARAKSLYGRSR